jgi:hypothetical protein
MFAKILSVVREKFRKPSPQKESAPTEDTADDPIAELVIQLDDKGDFAIGVECFSTKEEYAAFMGTTLYLINSGMLADYFVEALRVYAGEDESKIKFVMKSMEYWKEFYEKDEGVEDNEHKDAVDPKDVFSFYTMRP